jgi:hypothetical protein
MKKIYAVALVCASLFLSSCEIDGGTVDVGNIWIPPPPPVPKHTDIDILAFYVSSLSQDKLPELQDTGFKVVLEYAPAGSSGETLKTFKHEVNVTEPNKHYELLVEIDVYSVEWERGSSSSWGAYAFERVEADETGTEYKILYIPIGRTYWSDNEFDVYRH